jgi:hypothetical protein
LFYHGIVKINLQRQFKAGGRRSGVGAYKIIPGRIAMEQNGACSRTIYQIRIKGIVNRSIAGLIDDMILLPQENNDTLLVGTFIDQPALRGLLDQLWNLNLTILSVERVPPPEKGTYDPDP